MKALYDEVSQQCSRNITRTYSTSFSMGIYCLDKKLRQPIYSVYGFVRLADEIVRDARVDLEGIEGDGELYAQLKKPAMHLGAAFQKVNFLRDLNFDYNTLQRVYFPDLEMDNFTGEKKAAIEGDIRADFNKALEGIKCLPRSARFGVYVAYAYYLSLLAKIERYPVQRLLSQRLRLPSYQKFILLVRSFFSFKRGIL